MKCLIMNDLIVWKQSRRRKPLVLRGARQVGKTWVLEEFGKTFPGGEKADQKYQEFHLK